VREGLKRSTVTRLSLEVAQNQQKMEQIQKTEIIAILRLAKGFG
jgi:hypothetical protein